MIASATVQFYDVLVFLHIAAVVIGFGPTFAYAAFQAVAARSGMRASLGITRAILAWNTVGVTVCMVVIFLTGMYLASYDFWSFSDFFISWGFVAILVLFGLVHAFFLPNEKRMVAKLEEEVAKPGGGESTDPPAAITELGARIGRVGAATGLLIILTIYVMTAKPFL